LLNCQDFYIAADDDLTGFLEIDGTESDDGQDLDQARLINALDKSFKVKECVEDERL